MNLILTWSRKYSHDMAVFLRDWLPEVLPVVKPWVSSEDIQKGKKWFTELMTQFDETSFVILCVTAENVHSPWLYYEAGLIAAKQDAATVCPYLVGVSGKLVHGTPLAEFQWTEADRLDTWKLIKSINLDLKDQGYPEKHLEEAFKAQWPRLKHKLDKLTEEMGEVEEEVTQVHQPQSPTLREPAKQLLLAAAKDQNGIIMHIHTTGGVHLQTDNKDLVGSHDPKLAAKWRGALDELVRHGYVEPRGHKGEIFGVTDIGYDRAEELLASDPVYSLSGEAKQILAGASGASDGHLHFVTYDGGFQIMTNDRQFVPEHKPEEAATWKEGFDQLLKSGFIEATHQESVYRVTKKGYELSKELFAKDS